MSKASVLLEIPSTQRNAIQWHESTLLSSDDAFQQSESLLEGVTSLGGLGLEVVDNFPPVPMFDEEKVAQQASAFVGFTEGAPAADLTSTTMVVACEIDRSKLARLEQRADITVYPNSDMHLLAPCPECQQRLASEEEELFDLARSAGGTDCRPFRPAVTIEVLRELLGVRSVWRDGFRGQNIVVGIIDEGVSGEHYPVVGGFSRPDAGRQFGTARVQSHGSMCAADILVAAPAARLYDYPFLGVPNSGGALQMFQAVLDQRRRDGTPHLTNNSYGFVGVPPQATNPRHEIWDQNHPVHRKVREVVASGAAAFFAAGNCGQQCPSGACHTSGVGPGKSIHGSNSLREVITVAAVNSRHERIGYSSQGFGMFETRKPDISSYSHFYGNMGPGRPAGGGRDNFDNGTSAATPVAAGVAALLLSAFPGLTPAELKDVLILTASNLGSPGWDRDTGHGVINAAAAYVQLARRRTSLTITPVGELPAPNLNQPIEAAFESARPIATRKTTIRSKPAKRSNKPAKSSRKSAK